MTNSRPTRMEAMDEQSRVTPLELFFDLVFVFALTRVTDWMAEDATVVVVLRGALILAVMWWTWTSFAWLCNVVRADEGVVRVAMLAAMGVVFVAAITIPEAFDDLPGGLFGPTVFAVCYFAARLLHVAMFWIASRDDPQLRAQLLRFVPAMLAGTALLLIAAQTTDTTQTLLWVAALAVDLIGTLLSGNGWRLNSAGHFAERHGLIIIVALGESIVSIGIGVAQAPISGPIVLASALGLTVVVALWWAYFDVTALITERALAAATGATQIRLARGGYSYRHLPMIVGIIMMSLGLKKVLAYVAGGEEHSLGDPIYGVPLAALYGGAALYLLAHVAFKRYVAGQVSIVRLITVVILLALIPLVAHIPALLTLGILAFVLVGLVGYETARYAILRRAVRHAVRHDAPRDAPHDAHRDAHGDADRGL